MEGISFGAKQFVLWLMSRTYIIRSTGINFYPIKEKTADSG